MKKIFISTLTFLLFLHNAPANSKCIGLDCPPEVSFTDRMENYWHNFKSKNLWKSDNDQYWMNKFRGYKKYPIKFYNDEDLYANSGFDDVRTVEVHEYPRFTPVSARKGQLMYESITYTITYKRGSGERYRLDRDAVLLLRGQSVHISSNEILKPVGEVYMNGEYFMLLKLPHTSFVLTVDDHGNIVPEFGQVDSRGYYLVGRDLIQIKPDGTLVKAYSDSTETSSKPVFNFSVAYGGIEGREFALIIKDGTGEVQTRTVPMWKKMVTVNGTKFQIIYVGPDYIEYQIVY